MHTRAYACVRCARNGNVERNGMWTGRKWSIHWMVNGTGLHTMVMGRNGMETSPFF